MLLALIYESSIARAQPDPATAFRTWVAEAAPGLRVASWGGAGTGEVAYAAIVCTGETTFGAWDAQWLVETRDGRRWIVPGGVDTGCPAKDEKPAFTAGQALDQQRMRWALAGYHGGTFEWAFRGGVPVLLADTWTYSRSIGEGHGTTDYVTCVETSDYERDGEPRHRSVRRPEACDAPFAERWKQTRAAQDGPVEAAPAAR